VAGVTAASGALRVVVAGGGTGGHVTPALALAERIAERGDRVRLLGSRRGLETRLAPEAGFELRALPARQLAGRGALGRLRALPDSARACAAAWRELAAFDAQLVISVGGYAAAPAALAAVLRRTPLALVEPNAIPGRANRAAARFARRIFVQFEEAAEWFESRGGGGRVRRTGIPLRRALVETFREKPPRRAPELPVRLLVSGGSQGAHQINQALCQAAPRLDPAGFEIFHQTGEADREGVAAAYAATRLRAEVAAFEPDMPRRYRWADLALCRAGALTAAELALAGLPALLVPYPFAADDHQAVNARALARAGAARVLGPGELEAGPLAGVLSDLAAAPGRLLEMGAAAAKLARPDAAERIVEECAALAAGR
jgi:UDP-N-acetylglucosamine--N-acetylmuramyl-(pentapeptide) pyrophosphoryl-undecaprenol N-acetylglucosamine transferase